MLSRWRSRPRFDGTGRRAVACRPGSVIRSSGRSDVQWSARTNKQPFNLPPIIVAHAGLGGLWNDHRPPRRHFFVLGQHRTVLYDGHGSMGALPVVTISRVIEEHRELYDL